MTQARELSPEAGKSLGQQSISFADLPQTSKLFTDFLYRFDQVADFYSPIGRNGQPVADAVQRVTTQDYSRDELVNALTAQNRRFGSAPLVFERLAELRDNDSVAIVTGQQAGLFTGPLYTIMKALSIVRLTESLRREGIKAVPVFWIASEDHDFAEVNHCKVLNQAGTPVTISLTGCPVTQGQPVGHIHLCAEINQPIKQLLATLPDTPYKAEIADLLRHAYSPSAGFAEAFGRLMAQLLAPYGVILLDPLDEELKFLAKDIYQAALEQAAESTELIIQQNAKLQARGYHAQVHVEPDAVPLFLIHNGRRQALVRKGSEVYLKGTRQRIGSLAEVIARAETNPTSFSPNVTLRPVVQDTLLPTLTYVGGPAELAYFAQLQPLYPALGRVEPWLLARASATLIDAPTAKTFKKYHLSLLDFLSTPDALFEKVVTETLDRGTAQVLDETSSVIEQQLDTLRAALDQVDPTIAAALDSRRKKIAYQLNNVRLKFIRARVQQDELARNKLLAAQALLYPNRNFQERELNIFSFIARHGFEVIDTIYQAIDLNEQQHQLIQVN